MKGLKDLLLERIRNKNRNKNLDDNNYTRFPLDGFFQGVKRLFVHAFNNTPVDVPNNTVNNTNNRVERNSYIKYFLPRVVITDYNVLIDGRNFFDQPINDQFKKYDEIRKFATGKGDDYITGCFLDILKIITINCHWYSANWALWNAKN